MSLQQTLHEYNPWWNGAPAVSSAVVRRQKLLDKLTPLLLTPDVVLLTGLRRVGKTVTLKCLLDHLLRVHKVDARHCCYVSMDDYQLRGHSLIDVVSAFRQLHKLSVHERVFVFFDEITCIKDFQIQLKNLYDKGVVKCIASSSNSSLLKDDAAFLSGRKRIVEVDPLDFSEYLLFKNIHTKGADQYMMQEYFAEYMQVGGMPEYVLRGEREYLVDLIDDIIMKDLVAYHQLRNPGVIREFFVLLMERAGKQISINKVANILKISPDTAKRYLAMFEETYLIHLVSRHGKTNETLLSSKKVYATDIGMRNIIVGFRDKGAIFENLVFMKLKRLQPQYVLTQGQELDFFCNDTLIEAKYQRELEGKQLAAFDEYPAQHKLVVKGYLDLQQLDVGGKY